MIIPKVRVEIWKELYEQLSYLSRNILEIF
jgi:hypothetical protein